MSRPSRGFSVPNARPKSSTTCPSTGSTTLDTGNPDNWQVIFAWFPAVEAPTTEVFYRVNGGSWTLLGDEGDQTGGFFIFIDPSSVASNGDLLEFFAQMTDVAGCPDFATAVNGAIVTS